MLNQIIRAVPILVLSTFFALPLAAQTEGILLLAHGGGKSWNEEVRKLAAGLNATTPVEVAFGMARKQTIQDAIDRLSERNIDEIVAAPLFISSHSSVIRATEYLLGTREEAPPELEVFARMGHHGADTHKAGSDPTTPVETAIPIRMTPALDRHPLVADILISLAEAVSQNPEEEVVIIVAHGPVSDEENDRWLENMGVLAELMRQETRFSRIDYLTVRDDAPEPIRSQATADLRASVERATDEGTDVLIVPLLLFYGGIEKGIRKRLEGLPYRMSPQALLPDDRLGQWVLSVVGNRQAAVRQAGVALQTTGISVARPGAFLAYTRFALTLRRFTASRRGETAAAR